MNLYAMAFVIALAIESLIGWRADRHPVAVVSPVGKVMPPNCLMPRPKLMFQEPGQQGGAAPTQEPDEYPKGEFCKRPGDSHTPKDHPCHCMDKDDCSKPAEGQGTGAHENNQCKQWCHQDHCACKAICP